MARRYGPPFHGKRFVGDSHTLLVHDLDNDTDVCRIDYLTDDQLVVFPNTPAGRIDVLLAKGFQGKQWAPCPQCLPQSHLKELLTNCTTEFSVDFHAS